MKKLFFTFSAMIALTSGAHAQTSPFLIYGAGLDNSTYQKGGFYVENSASLKGLLIEAPLDASNVKLPLSFSWRGNSAPTVVFTGNGNVGIGKTVPGNKLSIWEADPGKWQLLELTHSAITNSQFAIGNINNTYPVINQRNSNIIESYSDLHISAANADSRLLFETGRTGTEAPIRMVIDNVGRVGIGMATPALKLDVDGSAGVKQALIVKSNGVNSGELVVYKNVGGYYSMSANTGGFGLYNSDAATHVWFATPENNIGIGTTTPGEYRLAVNGKVKAQSIKVTMNGWPDYVFEHGYHLPSIPEVEAFIKTYRHLPEIPSAAEVQADGVELGDMNKKLLQKVEELTLYLIDQHKKIETLQAEVEMLKKNK